MPPGPHSFEWSFVSLTCPDGSSDCATLDQNVNSNPDTSIFVNLASSGTGTPIDVNVPFSAQLQLTVIQNSTPIAIYNVSVEVPFCEKATCFGETDTVCEPPLDPDELLVCPGNNIN